MIQSTIDLPVVATSQQNTQVMRAQDNAMSVSEIIGQVKLIQEVMGKVMSEGEHFGVIPGTGTRKTLLQPGAQKLCMTFRLAPEYQIQETNFDRGHKEYRVICTLKSISSGNSVGQGVGCCSTLESKYRWRGGARKCPECGKETIIKGKQEYGGGWLCFGKKGGCGEKWPDGAAEIEGQSVDKAEHDNPADFYNTVLKMAKKRAFVDATITATAASDIFTQDIGDEEGNGDASEPPKTPQDAPRMPPPRTPATPKKASPTPQGATAAPAPVKNGTDATPDKFLAACKTRLLASVRPEEEWAWWRYGLDQGWILPTESLAEAAPEKMFVGYHPKNLIESVKNIFNDHTDAVVAMAANCPPEMKEEIERGLVPMSRQPDPEPAKTKPAKGVYGCPACSSTAVKKHDDLVGVRWCESCGTQWQDGSTVAYEEHPWMWAKLPFAPKDEAKKTYKGMSLGQISRLDNKYWYGVVMNFEAKPFKGRPPSEESVRFAEACELARKHLQDENTEKEALAADGPPDPF